MPHRWPGVRGRRSEDRLFREHSTFVLGKVCRVHGGVGAGKTLVVDGAGRLQRFRLRQGSPGDLHRAFLRRFAGSRRKLRVSHEALYGTRDATQLWQKELESTLKDFRFKDSRLHPGFFYHKGWDIALVSHVDDLLIGWTSENLVWSESPSKGSMTSRGRMLTKRRMV